VWWSIELELKPIDLVLRFQLEAFFDQLCAPTDDPTFGDPPTSIVPRQFKRKALTVMYQFVQAHAKAIHGELQEFPAYAVQVLDCRHRTHLGAV
jgi:hypothetical protein